MILGIDMKTLVLFAHPRTDRSEIGYPMYQVARRIPGVTAVDLYAEYPDFGIDVEREQERLIQHDAVVLQHPLYWYSVPSLLKEWQDLVFEHNFAYGNQGHALDDKILLNATTAGGKREAYTVAGANGVELRQLLLPLQKSAELCRMKYLAPFAIFGAGRAKKDGTLNKHLDMYQRLLTAMVNDQIDLAEAKRLRALTDNLDAVIKQEGA